MSGAASAGAVAEPTAALRLQGLRAQRGVPHTNLRNFQMRTRLSIVPSLCLGLLCATALSAAQPGDQPAPEGPQPAEAGTPPATAPVTPRRNRGGLPDDVPGLQQAAIEAYEAGDYLRFVQATIKLRNLRPYEPQYMVGMVVGTALIGRQTSAYSYMHKMQQQGLSFDFNSTDDTNSIRGTEVYDYINDLLIRAGDPLGEANVAFTLPESDRYPEAIAWDPTRERFLIGTLETGAVMAVSPAGEREKLFGADGIEGMWAIHGLVVDAERNRLWVSTAAVPAFQQLAGEDLGKSALLGFDLASLELKERHEVPADGLPHVLGSVEVLGAGDVYVIDRVVPMLYRKAAAGQALEPFLGVRHLVGLRDLAASEDGQRLYVADAEMGILVVNPGEQKSAMLAGPETLNQGGISGLMVAGNSLLMLQSGIRPQRLMRLDLDDAGMAVASVAPIASGLEPFHFPSFGTVHDGLVYYFASSNLPGANEGRVKPVVLVSPVEPAEEQVTPEARRFREQTFGTEPPEEGSNR